MRTASPAQACARYSHFPLQDRLCTKVGGPKAPSAAADPFPKETSWLASLARGGLAWPPAPRRGRR
ncbi:hypothetical protein GH733_011801 [Mirounga leonina]|nr:hypothetical protein GH733_011801 [Mirounga leonina]